MFVAWKPAAGNRLLETAGGDRQTLLDTEPGC